MTGAESTGPLVDIIVESEQWNAEPQAEAIVSRAVAAAAHAAGSASNAAEVAVVLTDNATIRALNAQWRGLDKPTNVLSFPAADQAPSESPSHLGDIVIAYETTAAESTADEKPFPHHLAHLAVHGYLHLIGYDHETEHEAEDMESLETAILAGLGIPDPYANFELLNHA